MPQIKPGSPVPKYFQLREILLDLIEGELEVDQPIPSERDLMQRYGISRMTVRQAVDQLVAEGRLYRVASKGTFVAEPKLGIAPQLASFTEDMLARGMKPGARLLDSRTVPASGHLARELELTPGAALHYVERLRTADGKPMAIERAHIPADLAPGLLDEELRDSSLYALLEERYGISIDDGELVVGGGLVEATETDHLDLSEGDPVLRVQRRSLSAGRPVELCISTFRADRYELHTSLENVLPGTPGSLTKEVLR